MNSEEVLRRVEDKVDGLALTARQSGAPSHVLIEIKNDIKGLGEKLLEIEQQTTLTNGRVTALERWKLVLSTALLVTILLRFPQISALIPIIH